MTNEQRAKLKDVLRELVLVSWTGVAPTPKWAENMENLINFALPDEPVALGERELIVCRECDCLHKAGEHTKEHSKTSPEQKTFKECFECATKPGSPVMCKQCLWVRENYPPKEPSKTEQKQQTLGGQIICEHAHCRCMNLDKKCLNKHYADCIGQHKEPSKQETGEKTLTKQQKSNIAVENFNAGKWRGREDLKQELLEKLPESDAHSLQVWEIKEMLCNP